MIEERVAGNRVILWNDTHWVAIEIPDHKKGFVTFWYKWGSDNAYVDGNMVKVDWGYVLRG